MSASQIPNLLTGRGGSRSRGRGRGRGQVDKPDSDTQTRRDLDIQSTDTDAAVSRLSAVSLGYLDDPYAPYFVNGIGTRRLPIINRGTYTRTTALDILVDKFLALDLDNPSQKKQIISLGAGTDTRYFRLRSQNKHQNLIYHEFDFPSACRKKRQIVVNNELFKSEQETVFVEAASVPQTQQDEDVEWGFRRHVDENFETIYCCHPLDLRRLPYRNPPPILHGLQIDVPTLILSECCLCYLDVDHSRDVVKWFVERIPSLGIVLYEPLGADDSFGQMMVANLAARNIVMPSLKLYKTLNDQKLRLSELGFRGENSASGQEGETIENIWAQWIAGQEKERVDGLEGLDEVEEWQMLARHYSIVWGWKGSTAWQSWSDHREHS